MKKLYLCADDYGLSPSVSDAIEELARAGRINAFSVMIDGPEIDIKKLRAIKQDCPKVSIGLHLTLTKCFEDKPNLQKLMMMAFMRVLPSPEFEIKRQFEKFQQFLDFPPEHIDGHQHIHLLPIIRPLVFKYMPPEAYFRQCRGAGFGLKAKIIDALSRKVPLHIRTNKAFSGSYHFIEKADYRALFKQFLKGQPSGLLVMCHPGRVDYLLKERDPIWDDREIELAYFNSDTFLDDVKEAGFVL